MATIAAVVALLAYRLRPTVMLDRSDAARWVPGATQMAARNERGVVSSPNYFVVPPRMSFLYLHRLGALRVYFPLAERGQPPEKPEVWVMEIPSPSAVARRLGNAKRNRRCCHTR